MFTRNVYTCKLNENVSYRKELSGSLIGVKCIVYACNLLASLSERVLVCETSFGLNQRNADLSVNFPKVIYHVRGSVNFRKVFKSWKKSILKFILRIGKLVPVYRQGFLIRCVNPAALPIVRCYSIRPLRRGSWLTEWTTAGDELNCPASTSPVMSAWWRLMLGWWW